MSASRWQSALRRWRGETQPQATGGSQELEARLAEMDAVIEKIAPPTDEMPLEPRPPVEQNDDKKARSESAPALVYGEYDMGDRLTCPAAGITELVIETLADDARIRLTPDLTEIRITTESDGWESAQLIIEGERARLTGGIAERVEVPAGIAISIDEAVGDVRVRGLDTALRLETVEGDLRLENISGRVDVERVHADALVDDVAALHIGSCAGDLRFSGGDLEVGTIAGDARIERATAVRGAKIHGDLWVDRVEGHLELGLVHGDARLGEVGGAATLGLVAGDLRAANVRGGLTAGQTHGDAQLEGPFTGDSYTVTANGDVDIRLAAEDDVRLSVRALGRIRSNLSLIPNTDGTPSFTATLGEGKTAITVTCNGDLRIDAAGRGDAKRNWEKRWGPSGDPFADLSGLGDRIRQQVSASLAAAGINPETGEFNFSFGPGKVRGGRGRAPEPPRPPTPPAPPQPPRASMSHEQMAVLKMLEEGRITTEEADALLRALGA
jgi:DUF4097 and DUF4098 domain-containing protein YvlB